jgi:hypothetical protein
MNPDASEPGVKSGRLVAEILGSYFRKTPPSRPANTNPPVNFAHLSTGENGDSEAEFVASKANPGGLCWTPPMQVTNRRLPARQLPAKCLGYVAGRKALVSS